MVVLIMKTVELDILRPLWTIKSLNVLLVLQSKNNAAAINPSWQS